MLPYFVCFLQIRIIKQLCVFSPLLDASKLPEDPEEIKRNIPADALSELPSFLNGTLRLEVPVYTIYGVAEDLIVLERFKDGTYNVPNLHIIDETTTHAIKAPSGLTLRLFGLGGSLVNHRLFDHGDASLSIAGSPGVMWTTTLQMGHLISTVRKSFVLSEIRIFVTHPSPSREGLLAQLAVALRTDFTISSGLHFLYSSSFNEFSALPSIEHFRGILALARAQFMDLWNAVKAPLFSLVDDIQNQQLTLAYEVFEAMPSSLEQPTPSAKTINGAVASNTTSSLNTNESIEYLEVAFRNMWHFNLCDHSNGAMVLAVNGSRVSSESYSEGFNFEYRFAPSNSASASNPAGALASKAVDVSVPKNGSATRQSPSSANVKPVRTILRNPASISAKSDNKPKAASPVQTSAAIASSSTSEAKPSNTGTTSTSTQQATIAPQEPELPGVWVANGKVDKEEVKGYFDEEDRKFIKSVVTKGNYVNPEKMFALVYFSTQDEASQALSRIDREKAGRCSLIRHSHSNEFGPSNQASNGSGRGHRSTPSSTGWSTAGSTRGGRGSYRGRGGSGAPSSFSKSSSGRLGTSPKISHSQTVAPSASPAPTTVKPASKPADSAPATQN